MHVSQKQPTSVIYGIMFDIATSMIIETKILLNIRKCLNFLMVYVCAIGETNTQCRLLKHKICSVLPGKGGKSLQSLYCNWERDIIKQDRKVDKINYTTATAIKIMVPNPTLLPPSLSFPSRYFSSKSIGSNTTELESMKFCHLVQTSEPSRETGGFIADKPDRNYLNPVIKVNMTCKGKIKPI